jgi:hypothetical protein
MRYDVQGARVTELRLAIPLEACTEEFAAELRHLLSEFPGAFPVRGRIYGQLGTQTIDFGVSVSGNGMLPLILQERFGIPAAFSADEP